MLKNLSKNLRNCYVFLKSLLFEEKRKEDVINKRGLVGVKIHEKDGSMSYELSVMKKDHFGLEGFFFTQDSKRKIYENQKGLKSIYVEEWIPIHRITQLVNKKYGKEVINPYYKGLNQQEINIINRELPNLLN